MDPVPVFKSLADKSRLRILNLLSQGPLCVCHVQAALQLPQPKISKQLAYLKKHGLLASRRQNNWTIYELSPSTPTLLQSNLTALKETFSQAPYSEDSQRLQKIDTSVACLVEEDACC